MKKIILMALVLSTSVFAHEILGTFVLPGSVETKVVVNQVKTSCEVRIDKDDITNLKVKDDSISATYIYDSWGNPAYEVKVKVSLGGKLRLNPVFVMNNLHKVEDKLMVKDFEYHTNDGSASMLIDEDGGIVSVTVLRNNEEITCNF